MARPVSFSFSRSIEDAEAHMSKLRQRWKRPKRDLDEGGVPVEPNWPRDLSGGAAAPLEFDN